MTRVALAVMAKAPRPGQVKTRLVPPLTPEGAAALYRAFLLDTFDTVRRVRGAAPAVAFAPADAEAAFTDLAPDLLRLPQGEGDLGARMAGVVDGLIGRGFERVLLIGGDTPTLPTSVLDEAVARLAEGSDLVLGPSDDGGYYLIGLRARQPSLFEGIAWSTETVLAETLRRAARARLSPALLPSWFDVDTAAELPRLKGTLGGAEGRQTGAFLARTPV